MKIYISFNNGKNKADKKLRASSFAAYILG